MSSSRRALHVVETFLDHSEIFIFHYITAHRAWHPVVLSMFRRNEDAFPIPEIFTVPYATSKRQPRWWWEQAVERATRRSPWQRRAEAVARAVKPGVIHAHFGQQGFRMLPVRRRLGIPLVTTFYGYDMSVLPRQERWQKRYRELFREGDLFLVEGPHMRECLIELGAPEEKVQVQRIAIPMGRYPRWQPSASPVAVFVGRFREKKGLRYALEAVLAVKPDFPDLQFRIIGDGEERSSMDAFVSRNRMGEFVSFLGMRPHAEVLAELTRASVLVHPSVTAANGDSEGGAPTILLEAQAIGVPLVSTFHADIPNVVDAKEGGVYLSPERNVEDLARQLRRALEERKGTEGAFVRKFHDVTIEVARLEERYLRLTTGH